MARGFLLTSRLRDFAVQYPRLPYDERKCGCCVPNDRQYAGQHVRDLIERHNRLNGIRFSVGEFSLIGILVAAFAGYYALHGRWWLAVTAGGIAANCAAVVVCGMVQLRRARVGDVALQSFWNKAARGRLKIENPHMLRDTIVLNVATLLPFVGAVAVIFEVFQVRGSRHRG